MVTMEHNPKLQFSKAHLTTLNLSIFIMMKHICCNRSDLPNLCNVLLDLLFSYAVFGNSFTCTTVLHIMMMNCRFKDHVP
jgi:hypothetical protein